MKLVIAGGRTFNDYAKMSRCLVQYAKAENLTIVSGTAGGADVLGEKWAAANNKAVALYPAKWNKLDVPNARIKTGQYGKYNANAGHDRNRVMANVADRAVCFWNGKSAGTRKMIAIMEELNKPCYVVGYHGYVHDNTHFFELIKK